MTTQLVTLTGELREHIAGTARSLDCGQGSTRAHVSMLAHAGLVGLGAPCNADGELPAMAAVISGLAAECMSTAFSTWAHRMTIEYLTVASTPWARQAAVELNSGDILGVTGMASAFKDAAGCGQLDLVARASDGGYVISGALRWASNLHPDSIMVTAAQTEAGEKIILGLPLSAPGVTIGEHFELLALGSTASSFVKLDNVRIDVAQVLTRDVDGFLQQVRPTFLVLQSAMCLGLAGRCLAAARAGVAGVNEVFGAEVEALADRLSTVERMVTEHAASVGTSVPDKAQLLTMRLAAAEVASSAAALEIRTAGGKGYARSTDASRRFREAAFIPVQSPSESQLRWELGKCA